MRDGLKNRVNGNQYYLEPNTLSQILLKEGISKLTFNSRIKPDPNFCHLKNGHVKIEQVIHLIWKEEIIIMLHLGNLLKDIEKL